jgi:DNA-binding transcriptional MerR regulator
MEPSAIRFYESAGVLPAPTRSEAGYRVYGETEIELMRFVRRLRALELPLDDIREIVRLGCRGRLRVNPSAMPSPARHTPSTTVSKS